MSLAWRQPGWETEQDFLFQHVRLIRPNIGGEMKISLGFARRLKEISAVVQTLRDHGINVIGPFRRHNGTFVYCLGDCIVTDHELLDLAIAGKLDVAGVSEFTAKIMRNA
jgi:hypothetical protein